MDDFDQSDALVGSFQALALPHDVVPLEQHLDDGRARRGRSQPGLLHGFRQFLLVESFACRLHGREQRAFREALGRPSLLFQGFDIDHLLRLSLRQTRRQALLPSLFLAASRTPLRLLLNGEIQHLPA